MDRQVQSGKKTVFLICFFIKYETKLVLICRFFIYNAQWAKNSAIRNSWISAKISKISTFLWPAEENSAVDSLYCTFWDKFGNLYTYIPR